jgi:hypothetical protein
MTAGSYYIIYRSSRLSSNHNEHCFLQQQMIYDTRRQQGP